MSGENTMSGDGQTWVRSSWGRPELVREDGCFQAVFTKEREGRAVVVVADRLEGSEWLQVLAFVVGQGTMDLVAHTVRLMPPDPSNLPLLEWANGLMVDWPPRSERAHLTTAVVRSATTTRLEQRARQLIAARRGLAWHGAVDVGRSEKRSRPRTSGDLRRAQVAKRYVELCGVERSQRPKADLARELCLAVNTVNSLLFQARERGLLTSDGQGRAGGTLTPLAMQLLDAAPSRKGSKE